MNEFLAALRCATVPNGYQVSAPLLFVLLMLVRLSLPLCVWCALFAAYVDGGETFWALWACTGLLGVEEEISCLNIRFPGRLNLESMLVAAARLSSVGD